MSNGVPGRGLEVERGVDSSTGIFGAGVPAIVTKTFALVIDGLGLGESGEPDGNRRCGAVVVARGNCERGDDKSEEQAFGHGRLASTLRREHPFHPFVQR